MGTLSAFPLTWECQGASRSLDLTHVVPACASFRGWDRGHHLPRPSATRQVNYVESGWQQIASSTTASLTAVKSTLPAGRNSTFVIPCGAG